MTQQELDFQEEILSMLVILPAYVARSAAATRNDMPYVRALGVLSDVREALLLASGINFCTQPGNEEGILEKLLELPAHVARNTHGRDDVASVTRALCALSKVRTTLIRQRDERR